MSDIASHDDGALQVHTGADRILRQFLAHSVDALIQVDDDGVLTLASLSVFSGNQFCGIAVHLLQPDTVAVDLRLDVTVCRAAHAHTDGAAGTVTWQTNHADIVSYIFATELSTEADIMSFLQQLLLEIHIAEGTACLIARCGQRVVVLDAGQLHRQQVLLSAGATDYEGDVVRRTSSGTQALHLLHEERNQCTFVLDSGLGHRIEIGLIGGTAALGDHDEAIFCTLASLDVNLCRQVATCVHLVVHVQRSVLRVAQVVLCEGVEDTERECFLILETCPHLLAFLTMNDGGTCVLTERKNSLCSHFGIAQELQRYIFIILAGLRVVEDGSHLQVVLTTKHELHIVESLLSQQRQCLR